MEQYKDVLYQVRSVACNIFGIKFFQFLVLLANALLAITGTILILIGVYLISGSWISRQYWQIEAPAIALISVGGCLVIVAGLGVLAAVTQNALPMNMHSLLVLILLIAEINVTITYAVSYGDLRSRIEANLMKDFISLKGNDWKMDDWDRLQNKYECCGVTHAIDWVQYNVTGPKINDNYKTFTVPYSCCNMRKPDSNSYNYNWQRSNRQQNETKEVLVCNVHHDGCADQLRWRIEGPLTFATFTVVAAIVIKICGLLFACLYAAQIRRAKTENERQRQDLQHLISNNTNNSTDA